jgi:AcrR family transcriptional regulator
MRPRSFSDEDLLETARRIFLDKGPGVSTTRIAEALGVSQAALFKRFATKKQLMLKALLPKAEPKWITHIAKGPDDRPVPEQLLEIVHRIDSFFSRMMPALQVIRAAGIDPDSMFDFFPGDPPPVRAHAALSSFFATLHEEGRISCEDPHATASAFMGAMHGHHNMRHMLGDRAPCTGDDYPERLVAIFWNGMKPA